MYLFLQTAGRPQTLPFKHVYTHTHPWPKQRKNIPSKIDFIIHTQLIFNLLLTSIQSCDYRSLLAHQTFIRVIEINQKWNNCSLPYNPRGKVKENVFKVLQGARRLSEWAFPPKCAAWTAIEWYRVQVFSTRIVDAVCVCVVLVCGVSVCFLMFWVKSILYELGHFVLKHCGNCSFVIKRLRKYRVQMR